MDRQTQKWLVLGSIAVAAAVILLLMLSGFDLSGFKIHKGIGIR